MKKCNLIACTVLAAAALLAIATDAAGTVYDRISPSSVTEARRHAKKQAKASPLSAVPRLQKGQLPNRHSTKTRPYAKPISRSVAPLNVTEAQAARIYGGAIFADSWTSDSQAPGVYSFIKNDGSTLTPEALGDDYIVTGGGTYAGGKYYAVSYMQFMGMMFAYLSSYDIDTWQQLTYLPVDPGSVAQDMEYDPTTGYAYGCFMNDDADGWVFGYLNLDTGERTRLKDLDLIIITVAVTPEGDVYGIGLDGMLYKFDKKDGSRVAVGSTGRRPQYSASGTIDPVTGVFYWECMEADAKARLYTVDLTTGAATYVTDIKDNTELTGMFIPVAEAADDAPAAVADLSLSFPGTSLSGAITFTAPSRTFASDSELSGSLSYEARVNDQDEYRGTAVPGEAVSIPLTVTEPGRCRVTVTVSNDAGKSPIAAYQGWVGADIPLAPANIKVVRNVVDGNMSLTWEAPEGTVHDGYINKDEITYTVVRMPGEVAVASNLSGTSFSETISEDSDFSVVYYTVTPSYGGAEGITGESNRVGVGIRALPYVNPVDTEEDFNELSVEDTNADGETWAFEDMHQAARCRYSTANSYTEPMNDWIFTPAVKMMPGRMYRVAARISNYALYNEAAELGFGPLPKSESMTLITDRLTINNADNPKTYEKYVTVDTEGKYYFGVHGCSPADRMYLYADDFSISEGPIMGSPGAVTALTIVPAAQGVLQTTISFTAPTKTVEGTELTSIDAVDIYRNGKKVTSLTGANPGAQMTYTDTEAEQNDNLYRIIARNASGEGYVVEKSVFVGHDRPGIPVNIVASESDGAAVITWDAPVESENGGFFDPSVLTYTVVRGNDEVELATGLNTFTFTDANPPLAGERQEFFQYWVYAQSPAGYGYGASSNVVTIGDPYETPFIETFPDGKISHGPWDVRMGPDDPGNWGVYHEGTAPVCTPYDNDGGMVGFNPADETAEGILVSPKISLSELNSPVVQFRYYNHKFENARIDVMVSVDDAELKRVGTIAFDDDEDAGWKKGSFDISDYADGRAIQIAFKVSSPTGTGIVYIDNIMVRENYEYNLAARRIEAPQRMMTGEKSKIRVFVENVGRKTAKSYSVELLRDGKIESTLEGVTTLPDATREYVFEITPLNLWPDKVKWSARVVYADDVFEGDNVTETVETELTRPNYPAVTDLQGSRQDDSSVLLTWSEPTLGPAGGEMTAETVEDYEAFAISGFGDWAVRDVDGSGTYGISDNAGNALQYPNASMPMAYQVFNPSMLGIPMETSDGEPTEWAPHSGYQMFICMAASSGKNDDWLISPLLPGIEQEISFWVKSVTDQYGFEKYEVYYSTTGIEPADFMRIGDRRSAPVSWTQEKVTLPQGARYFAIRCVSEDCYVFMVDDINFYASSGYTGELSLIGYNVYRDDDCLTSEPIMEQEYNDAADENAHKYNVTVVYDKGESVYSNTVEMSSSSVNGIGYGKVKVSAAKGMITVSGAEGLDIRVVDAEGRVITSFVGTASDSVSADAGVYLVIVDNRAIKVQVR